MHKREERLLAELREMPPNQIKGRPQVERELNQINIECLSLIDKTIKEGHELGNASHYLLNSQSKEFTGIDFNFINLIVPLKQR